MGYRERAEIAVLEVRNGITSNIWAASFSPDGKRVVTGPGDTARIFDVSRTDAFTHGRALVLTAALARGTGKRTNVERDDLLMRGLSDDDMFVQALKQLGRTADDPRLQETIAALHAPLHDNCYLSPTQLADKLRLTRPRPIASKQYTEDQATQAGDEACRTGPASPPVRLSWLVALLLIALASAAAALVVNGLLMVNQPPAADRP